MHNLEAIQALGLAMTETWVCILEGPAVSCAHGAVLSAMGLSALIYKGGIMLEMQDGSMRDETENSSQIHI